MIPKNNSGNYWSHIHSRLGVCQSFSLILSVVVLLECTKNNQVDQGHPDTSNTILGQDSGLPTTDLIDATSIDSATPSNRLDAFSPITVQTQDSGAQESSIAISDSEIDSASAKIPITIPVLECENEELPNGISMLLPPALDESDSVFAGHLLVKDSYLYFVKEHRYGSGTRFVRTPFSDASLYRVKTKCGASIQDLGITGTITGPTGESGQLYPPGFHKLVSGAEFVYMASGKLQRLNADNLSHTTLDIGENCISDIAANETHVFVYDRCEGRIARAAHGQNDFETVSNAGFEGFLALGTDAISYSSGLDVYRKRFDSAFPALLYSSQSDILGLNGDDRALFVIHDYQLWIDEEAESCFDWNACGTTTVTRIPTDGGKPEAIATLVSGAWPTSGGIDRKQFAGTYLPGWVTPVQDGKINVREVDDNNVTQVVAIETDGTGRTAMLRRTATYLAVEGDRLFWMENGGIFTASVQSPVAASAPTESLSPLWKTVAWKGGYVRDVATSPDNSIVLLGTPIDTEIEGHTLLPPEGGYQNALLVKLTDNGEHIWSKLVAPEIYSQIGTGCLSVDSVGRITVVIEEFDTNQLAIHRFEPDGTEIGKSYPGIGNSSSASCIGDSEGNVYFDAQKYDPNGNLVWYADLYASGLYGFRPWNTVVVGDSGIAVEGPINWTYDANEELVEKAVVRVDADGNVIWATHYGVGAGSDGVSGNLSTVLRTDESGRILVMGETTDFVTTGNEWLRVPRLFERFTYMLWLASDGSVESLRLLDGVANNVVIDQKGNAYLISGEPARPFLFDPPNAPGNYLYGVVFAGLDPNGMLIDSANLSPTINTALPDGYLQLDAHVAIDQTRVIVAGTIGVYGDHSQGFPPWKRPDPLPQIDDEAFVAVFEPL